MIQFDVHLVKDRNGKRYIERITEICPSAVKDGCFTVQDILYWNLKQECYQFCNRISERQLERIRQNMTEKEWIEWQKWYGEQEKKTENFT